MTFKLSDSQKALERLYAQEEKDSEEAYKRAAKAYAKAEKLYKLSLKVCLVQYS